MTVEGGAADTFVNGHPVTDAPLRHGDELAVGPARFVHRRESAFASADRPPSHAAGGATLVGTVGDEQMSSSLVYEAMLERTNGDIDAAAKLMGLEPEQFRNELRRRRLDPDQFSKGPR